MTLRVHYFLSLFLLLGAGCAGAAAPPTTPATPSPAVAEATSLPAPTATATRPETTTAPPTLTPTTEPTATLEPTATPEPLESLGFFNPQCDRRPFEIERPTQIHPETGESWTLYANEAYGFSFLFPPEWALIEGDNYLCLNYQPKREIKLVIGYKWFDDRNVSIIRTGVAAGELTAGGEIEFLGREVARNILRYEGKDKALLYANAAHIRANDLFFTLSLDDFSADYDQAELTPEIMDRADAIVESFELIDRLIVNETYGFAFTLPPEWRISPQSGQNLLRLTYRPDRTGDTALSIGFKWEEEEDIRIMRTGTGAVDEFIEGEIEFMGRTISRVVWRFEDKTTAVFYHGASHINVNGLLFTLSLDYWDPRQMDELSEAAMVSADAIVQSFRLTWEEQRETLQVDGLGFSIDTPTVWRSHLENGAAYFHSDIRYGDGPTPWTYYVYALEYPNPDQLPLAEAVTAGLSEGIQENFTYTTDTIGGQTVYVTEWMPSAYGALTVFYERNGRYLALALTPYDSQNPYPAQARYLSLFEAMLASVRLPANE